MGLMEKFLLLILAIFVLWSTLAFGKRNPEMFSKKNLSASFTTAGIMALALIALVYLAIVFLK